MHWKQRKNLIEAKSLINNRLRLGRWPEEGKRFFIYSGLSGEAKVLPAGTGSRGSAELKHKVAPTTTIPCATAMKTFLNVEF